MSKDDDEKVEFRVLDAPGFLVIFDEDRLPQVLAKQVDHTDAIMAAGVLLRGPLRERPQLGERTLGDLVRHVVGCEECPHKEACAVGDEGDEDDGGCGMH